MRQPDGTLWRPAARWGLRSAAACPSSTTLTTQHGEHQRKQLTNGTLEICTCTGSTDRDEPPTGRHRTAMEEMTRHRDTRTSRMQTPARPDRRQGAQLDFFSSLRKGGRNGFVKLINCSGSASWKRAPFVLLFLHERASPWKNPREYSKKNLPFPFPLPAPSTRAWLGPCQRVLNAR